MSNIVHNITLCIALTAAIIQLITSIINWINRQTVNTTPIQMKQHVFVKEQEVNAHQEINYADKEKSDVSQKDTTK